MDGVTCVNPFLQPFKNFILLEVSEMPRFKVVVAKNVLLGIGIDFECINTFPNDFFLYHGDNVAMESCFKF